MQVSFCRVCDCSANMQPQHCWPEACRPQLWDEGVRPCIETAEPATRKCHVAWRTNQAPRATLVGCSRSNGHLGYEKRPSAGVWHESLMSSKKKPGDSLESPRWEPATIDLLDLASTGGRRLAFRNAIDSVESFRRVKARSARPRLPPNVRFRP